MYVDPHLMKDLADLRLKELRDAAEQHRRLKQLGASEDSVRKSISAALSGWIQRKPALQPEAIARITGDVKRTTGEIPSV